jgi:UDP-N-acetylmuramate dehydrogenase
MKDIIFESLQLALPSIQKNIPIASYTTFNIGGTAKYFLETSKKEDIVTALVLAKKLKLPFFILGGGSNVLVSDKGFKGLIIRIKNPKEELLVKELQGNIIIEAPAGIEIRQLVSFSVENGLQGLEWAGGLPGTFGGAIRGNAGAFGGEIKDSIFQVEAFDKNILLRKFSHKECQFSYRSSIFKKKQWIILSAQIKLKRGNKQELENIANSRINYRKEKHPLEYPSAGSVFKNVDVKKIPKKFQTLFFDKIKKDPFPIVPSAWFIIEAGLTGKKIGQAQISKKHSNYIVNLGGAKAKDVLQLIALVKKVIKKKYGVLLEQEIQFLE